MHISYTGLGYKCNVYEYFVKRPRIVKHLHSPRSPPHLPPTSWIRAVGEGGSGPGIPAGKMRCIYCNEGSLVPSFCREPMPHAASYTMTAPWEATLSLAAPPQPTR